MLHALPDIPQMRGAYLAAADLNAFRSLAAGLDRESRRGRIAFTSYAHRPPADFADGKHNPNRIWHGALQYRAGMTTATLVCVWTKTGSETYTVKFDGVTVASGAVVAGTQTLTIAIDSRGWQDEQIVAVEVWIANGDTPQHGGSYVVQDAYTGPLSSCVGMTWPGVPTFSGSPRRDWLQQLRDATTYIYRRLLWARDPLQTLIEWWEGPMDVKPKDNPGHLWTGSISKANGLTTLAIDLWAHCQFNVSERIRVYVNGSVAASQTIGAPYNNWLSLNADLSSLADGVVVPVRIETDVLTQKADDPMRGTRFSLASVRLGAATSYSIPAPIAAVSPGDSVTWATAETALNALRSSLLATYNRIQAAPDVFDKQRMSTARPVPYESDGTQIQKTVLITGTAAAPPAVWVSGKDVTLAYGGVSVTKAKPDEVYEYTFAHEESIIGSDKVDSVQIETMAFNGLVIGAPLALLGDVQGAWGVNA